MEKCTKVFCNYYQEEEHINCSGNTSSSCSTLAVGISESSSGRTGSHRITALPFGSLENVIKIH